MNVIDRIIKRLLSAIGNIVHSRKKECFDFATRVKCVWTEHPCAFEGFYSKHDERCEEVLGVDGSRMAWRVAHILNNYPVHTSDDLHPISYLMSQEGDTIRLHGDDKSEHWMYFVSRRRLPIIYAIEFDYKPERVCNEQLQLCFAADSLAERHRFVLNFNKEVYYQIISRGYWLPHFSHVPCSLPLNKWSHIRLEVVGQVFSLIVNDGEVLSVKDSSLKAHKAHNMMIFWNGKAKNVPLQEILVSIRGFKYFTGQILD